MARHVALLLPGLTIHIFPGPGPRLDAPANDTPYGALFMARDPRRYLTAQQALARAAGRPYDPHRLEIFEALLTELNNSSLAEIVDPAQSGVARENFAFFEAYFSNYIEGTTFTVEEAEDIVFHGQIVENRNEDSHDILKTCGQEAGRVERQGKSREAHPLVAALSRIQRGSAAFDYAQTRSLLRGDLARCNAFQEDLRS